MYARTLMSNAVNWTVMVSTLVSYICLTFLYTIKHRRFEMFQVRCIYGRTISILPRDDNKHRVVITEKDIVMFDSTMSTAGVNGLMRSNPIMRDSDYNGDGRIYPISYEIRLELDGRENALPWVVYDITGWNGFNTCDEFKVAAFRDLIEARKYFRTLLPV